MSEWFNAIEGTPEARLAALGLALLAAVAHAVFGALQKGRHDPWLTRGAIDFWLIVLTAPIALLLVPLPEGNVWWILAGALGIHFVYKLLMAMAYSRAAFTVVYPVVRGTGTLVTVALATLVFAERYSLEQWLGVLLLSGGILALAVVNLRAATVGLYDLRMGLIIACLGGGAVAIYTIYDAYGIRATPNPFTFLAWFFLITAIDFPVIAVWRYARMPDPPAPGPLLRRGLAGALIAWVSFGSIMLATRIDKVGQAAVLRETSVVFAAVIGWAFLGERLGWLRASLVMLIATGAVIVEFG